jgi:hypothetical protein
MQACSTLRSSLSCGVLGGACLAVVSQRDAAADRGEDRAGALALPHHPNPVDSEGPRLLRGWDPNCGVGGEFYSCNLGAEAYRLQTGLLAWLSDEAEKVLVVHFFL